MLHKIEKGALKPIWGTFSITTNSKIVNSLFFNGANLQISSTCSVRLMVMAPSSQEFTSIGEIRKFSQNCLE